MNRYTVIIPVFNALEHVKRCIESVLKHTPEGTNIFVIDDASTDAEVIRYLQAICWDTRMTFSYHDRNWGFVRTANEGMRWALEQGTEPILLNSDTVVPERWIERLDEARTQATERGLRVAAISPLSNEASHYSVPNAYGNELPDGINVEEMDRIVEETSGEDFPAIPCAVGFCMLMTREAIEEVGLFDTKWGKGYGEETDWSVRAIAKGFSCILADNLFVWHKHHASFQWEARELREEHQAMFLEQYPGFDKVLDAWELEANQRRHRVAIADRLWPRRIGNRRRILFVCHHWGKLGGLEIFQLRLAHELSEVADVVVMYPERRDLTCDGRVFWSGNLLHVAMSPRMVEPKIDLGIFPFQFSAEHVEKWFADCLEALQPDVTHFHHLGGWGTFRLPEIAQAFGPTVLSVHDDFYLCPSYLTAGWTCGRDRAEDCEQCRECVQKEWLVRVEGRWSEQVPTMLEERRGEIYRMMRHFDNICFPSKTLHERYRANLDAVDCVETSIIPHGVPRYPFAATYKPGKKIRIAWVGGVLPEKGWNAFAGAARALKFNQYFEFSVLGEWHDMADRSGLDHVTFTGRYSPEELPQLLQRVDLAIPAVARKEAYGLVVDECLAASCPVLLPDVPTMRERYPAGSAWYSWGETHSLVAELLEFVQAFRARSQEDICKARNNPNHHARVGHLTLCALRYDELYKQLLAVEE